MRIASVALAVVLVAGIVIYAVFTFRREPEQKSYLKYISSDISNALDNIPLKVENINHTIHKSDTDSYDFKLDISVDGFIIHMPGKALNKNYSGDCVYDCYFSNSFVQPIETSAPLLYIYSEQGDSSYRIFLKDDDIVCVVVGGEKVLTYNYGDEEITDDYYEIVKKAKDCYSEINEKDLAQDWSEPN